MRQLLLTGEACENLIDGAYISAFFPTKRLLLICLVYKSQGEILAKLQHLQPLTLAVETTQELPQPCQRDTMASTNH